MRRSWPRRRRRCIWRSTCRARRRSSMSSLPCRGPTTQTPTRGSRLFPAQNNCIVHGLWVCGCEYVCVLCMYVCVGVLCTTSMSSPLLTASEACHVRPIECMGTSVSCFTTDVASRASHGVQWLHLLRHCRTIALARAVRCASMSYLFGSSPPSAEITHINGLRHIYGFLPLYMGCDTTMGCAVFPHDT